MNQAWVHIFAKFTDELLLFQALLIFLLGAGYAAYWLLKRRKDMLHQDVPAKIVKSYLGSLIADAESLRGQLFGIMQQIEGIDGSHKMPSMGVGDPALLQRMSSLEKQAQDQAAAMQALLAEKERIMKELEAARTAGGAGAAPAGDNSDLLARIASLEAKLAEYSIIEDDLANLKRLQQENTQLRNQLAGMDKAPAATAPQTGATAAVVAAATSAPAPLAPVPAPAFEAAVDQIEKNLEPAPAAPEAVAQAPTPPEGDKSDADLVAEFEKMLNS